MTLLVEPKSVHSKRARSDSHQIQLAVREILPFSSIPKIEWKEEIVVAPISIVPGSEPFVVRHCYSVPSVVLVASPLLDSAHSSSVAVLPVVADLLETIAPDSSSEYRIADQNELFDPVVDAAPAEGVLEWHINDYAVSNSKSLYESLEIAFRLTKVYSSALHHFGLSSTSPVNFEDLLDSCRLEFSKNEQERAAKADSENFVLFPEILNNDLPALVKAGSLENLVRERQQKSFPVRLNIDRVNHSFGHLPGEDLERARSIASHGSRLVLPEGFVRQDFPSPMRPMAARLGNTYLKHGYKLWEKGQALLFNVNELPADTYNSLNFGNNAHWTGKPNCPEGRFLFDPNHPEEGFTGLNTEEGLERMRGIYGDMTLPTIQEFLMLIYKVCSQKGCHMSELSIWKEDVKGAFAQTNIDPMDAWLSAMMLSASIVIIFICGFFGYNGQPLVFNVFTRLINRALSDKLAGGLFMYVDDLVGVSYEAEADSDQLVAQEFLKGLFGQKALASDNTTPTKAADVIGWRVDLVKESIRPNDKGIRKLFLVLFVVIDNEAKSWPLVHVQVLSSLFERYSMAIMGMRAFITPINNLLSHNPNMHPNKPRKVSATARFCVVMWRAVTLIMLINPDALSVPISSVTKSVSSTIDYRATTDAANSIGLAVYNSLDELVLVTSYELPFSARDSKFQNAKEFMGLLLAVILIKIKLNPPRGTKIALTGDNTASLSWIEKNKANSPSAQMAFIAYSWVVITTGMRVEFVNHIAGASVQMHDIDALSRNYANGLEGSPKFMVTTRNVKLDNLFKRCDPTLSHGPMPDQLTEFETMVATVVDLFSSQ